jgi:regulator of protease activity HflC (stomatin/prohibitin superfamily)
MAAWREARQQARGYDASNANYMDMGHETLLDTVTIGSDTAAAYRVLGRHSKTHVSGTDTTIIRVVPSAGCCPYFTVPEGTYAIVTSFGEVMTFPGNASQPAGPIWPAGFHKKVLCCFSQIRELITMQTIIFDTPVKNCKTKDNINVTIDLCIHMRIMGDPKKNEDPELVKIFSDELGPSNLATQLKDAQSEAVRNMARAVTHEQVYALRSLTATSDGTVTFKAVDPKELNAHRPVPSGLKGDQPGGGNLYRGNTDGDVELMSAGASKTAASAPANVPVMAASAPPSAATVDPHSDMAYEALHLTAKMMNDLNNQFNKFGVQIIDLQIQDVKLPQNIHRELQEKTTTNSVILRQEKDQEFAMLRTAYREEKAEAELEMENKREKIEQEGKKALAEWQKQYEQIIADTNLQVLDVNEKNKSAVAEIEAARAKQLAQLTAETDKIRIDSQAQAEAKVENIKAQARKTVNTTLAEAELTIEQAKAESTKLIAIAEGKASANFARKRAFELAKKQLAVHHDLANNPSVFIGGKGAEKGNLLADMLVSQGNRGVMMNVGDLGQSK